MQYSQTEVTKRNPMDRPPVTARAVRHSVAHCAVFHIVLFSTLCCFHLSFCYLMITEILVLMIYV